MTVLQLLTGIVAALLLQLTVGIAVVVARRRTAPLDNSESAVDSVSKPARGAWSGWRDFCVTQRTYEDASQAQCSFQLTPVDGEPLAAFLPGQFLTFSLPAGAGHDSGQTGAAPVIRCYSLSDRPDPAGYRVTVKRVSAPAGRPDLDPGVASTYFHDQVQVGHILKLKAPAGQFFIDPDASVPAVLIAGGIGITPMMSMLRWCATEQAARTVHLYYCVRNGAERAFTQVLAQLAAEHPTFHITVVCSQPGADDLLGRDFHHAGRLDIDLLRRTLPHGRHQFYVCGPSAMMESLVPALVQWGVPPQDFHFEAFGPASVKLPPSAGGQEVTAILKPLDVKFSRSDRTLVWDGQDDNLLDFTDRQGLAIPSGCRSGSCGTCETRLIRGSVHYDKPPDHDVAPGCCLLCVGRPTTALVLEA